MIIIDETQDLLHSKGEYIVNAANSKGWMGGLIGKWMLSKGVAETLHYYSRGEIEKEAKQYCRKHKVKTGQLFTTQAYNLDYKEIIHVVTVKKPGWLSSEGTVEECLKNLVSHCIQNNIESCTITGLGTGTGRVSKEKVAELFIRYLHRSPVHFYVVDKNEKFLNALRKKI